MTDYPFSVALCAGADDAAGPVMRMAALHSWRTIDAQIATCPAASRADFAVYYHCVHQAFGYPTTGVLAQQAAERLARQPWPEPGRPWFPHQVDQAGALAWVSGHRVAAGRAAVCPPAQLAAFDEELYRQVQNLPAQPTPSCRRLLVRVARYLRLRQPAPTAGHYLRALLAHWPEMPGFEAAGQPVLLGLTDGLAAELLVLIRAHQAGLRHATIEARVEQGLRYLLSLKRDINFLEQQYSVFPYQVHSLALEGTFSAELSWRRGDVGQSWLLYEAQAVLNDRELVGIAELIGLNTVLRTSLPATGVADSGFYQGAAGAAQLYGQLHRISGHAAYRTAYGYWLSRTQALLAASQAPAQGENEPLDGPVGVALVLLAAAEPTTPNWLDVLV